MLIYQLLKVSELLQDLVAILGLLQLLLDSLDPLFCLMIIVIAFVGLSLNASGRFLFDIVAHELHVLLEGILALVLLQHLRLFIDGFKEEVVDSCLDFLLRQVLQFVGDLGDPLPRQYFQ